MDHQNFIALEDIRIAKPCRADWDAMSGNDRARFCGSCHKNVYDISVMTRQEARELILEREGNVCIRMYRRVDGTVITGDCPVGISTARRPFFGLLAGLAALLVSGAAVANQSQPAAAPDGTTVAQRWTERLRTVPFLSRIVDQVAPAPPPVMMGDVAYMPPNVPATVPTQAPTVVMGSPPPIMGKIAAPAPTPAATPVGTPALSHHALITMGEPTIKDPTPTPVPHPDGVHPTKVHQGKPTLVVSPQSKRAGATIKGGKQEAAKKTAGKLP